MSATFGAPLEAVVLAIELLLFEFSVRALVPLVISTAIAGGMHALLFDSGPLFAVPAHDCAGLDVLPAFVLLGLAAGVLAIVISRGLFFVEEQYRRLPVSEFWHPAIGAIGFATVGLFVPRVLGVGYDVIGDVLAGDLAVTAAATIAGAKLIAWWLALGSGTSGGTLAPVLLISSSFGMTLGHLLRPHLHQLGRPRRSVPTSRAAERMGAVLILAHPLGWAMKVFEKPAPTGTSTFSPPEARADRFACSGRRKT